MREDNIAARQHRCWARQIALPESELRSRLMPMHYLQGRLDLRRSRPASACTRIGAGVAVLLAGVSLAGTASAKPFEDYIKPTPEVAPLSSATWGVTGVPGVVRATSPTESRAPWARASTRSGTTGTAKSSRPGTANTTCS